MYLRLFGLSHQCPALYLGTWDRRLQIVLQDWDTLKSASRGTWDRWDRDMWDRDRRDVAVLATSLLPALAFDRRSPDTEPHKGP